MVLVPELGRQLPDVLIDDVQSVQDLFRIRSLDDRFRAPLFRDVQSHEGVDESRVQLTEVGRPG